MDSHGIAGRHQVLKGFELFRKPSSGAGAEEKIMDAATYATRHLPDGTRLVYSITGTNTKDDLWIVPLQGQRTPTKYLDRPSDGWHAQFSPDGRWMAYAA